LRTALILMQVRPDPDGTLSCWWPIVWLPWRSCFLRRAPAYPAWHRSPIFCVWNLGRPICWPPRTS